MSTSALNRTYPIVILFAVLAAAGLSLVQAGNRITIPPDPIETLDRHYRPEDRPPFNACFSDERRYEDKYAQQCKVDIQKLTRGEAL